MSPPEKGEPSVPNDAEGLRRQYRALSETISEGRPADVTRQLPGLVDAVVAASREASPPAEFHIGVSISTNDALFDYFLKRVPPGDATDARPTFVKEPIDRELHYLQFTYPGDPHFDAAALRGAILATLQRRIRELEADDDTGEDRLAGVWRYVRRGSTGD